MKHHAGLGFLRHPTVQAGNASGDFLARRRKDAKIKELKREVPMQALKYIHWQDGHIFLGYLEEYPDYWTQGESLDELRENLADLYRDFSSGDLPGILHATSFQN